MSDYEEAIATFLDAADNAFEEYDRGYADADATLGVVQTHVEELRETVEQ